MDRSRIYACVGLCYSFCPVLGFFLPDDGKVPSGVFSGVFLLRKKDWESHSRGCFHGLNLHCVG